MTTAQREVALADFFHGFRLLPLKILIASRSKITAGKNQGDWHKFQFADYEALQPGCKLKATDDNFILSTRSNWPELLAAKLVNSTGSEFHMSFNHEIDGGKYVEISKPNYQKFLFQLDDITSDNLNRLVSDFGKPYMTVNTSPGNYTVFCKADLTHCGRKFYDPLERAPMLKPRVLFYQETIRNWFIENYHADKNGSGQGHFFRIPYIPRINDPVGFMPVHTKNPNVAGLFLPEKIGKLFRSILDSNDKLYSENEDFEYCLNRNREFKPTREVDLKNLDTEMAPWFPSKFERHLKRVQKQFDGYSNQQAFLATKDVIRSVQDLKNKDLRDKYASWSAELMQRVSSMTQRDAEKSARKALGQIEAEIAKKQIRDRIENPQDIEDEMPL